MHGCDRGRGNGALVLHVACMAVIKVEGMALWYCTWQAWLFARSEENARVCGRGCGVGVYVCRCENRGRECGRAEREAAAGFFGAQSLACVSV